MKRFFVVSLSTAALAALILFLMVAFHWHKSNRISDQISASLVEAEQAYAAGDQQAAKAILAGAMNLIGDLSPRWRREHYALVSNVAARAGDELFNGGARWLEAADRYNDAFELARQAQISLNDPNYLAGLQALRLNLVAEAVMNSGNADGALHRYSHAITAHRERLTSSDAPPNTAVLLGEAMLQKVIIKRNRRDPQGALAAAEEAMHWLSNEAPPFAERGGMTATALSLAATAHMALKQNDEARQRADEAVRAAAEAHTTKNNTESRSILAHALNARGAVLGKLGAHRAGANDFSRALSLLGDISDFEGNWAHAYRMKTALILLQLNAGLEDEARDTLATLSYATPEVIQTVSYHDARVVAYGALVALKVFKAVAEDEGQKASALHLLSLTKAAHERFGPDGFFTMLAIPAYIGLALQDRPKAIEMLKEAEALILQTPETDPFSPELDQMLIQIRKPIGSIEEFYRKQLERPGVPG